jgi:hypothetical protein
MKLMKDVRVEVLLGLSVNDLQSGLNFLWEYGSIFVYFGNDSEETGFESPCVHVQMF